MAEKQVRIDLVANDKASEKVRDVAEEVEDLEKLDPEVEITADTTKAERQVEGLSDDLKALTRADQEVLLRADVDKAKGALREFQAELKQTGEQAQRTEKAVDDIGRAQGPRLAGNTVADLTGPLGEASGVASDVGGVFDGLGDTAESAWIKLGGSEQGAAKVASALGYVGFAVSAGIALWTLYQSAQKKAEEQQRKLAEGARKLRTAIEEGDIETGAEQLIEDYGDAYDAARRLRIPVEEVTAVLMGQADTVPTLDKAYQDLAASVEGLPYQEQLVRLEAGTVALDKEKEAILGSRDAHVQANVSLLEQDNLLADVAASLKTTTTGTDKLTTSQDKAKRQTEKLTGAMDRLQGSLNMDRALLNFSTHFQAAHDKASAGTAATAEEILDLKQDILDVAAFAGLNPIEVQTMLDRVTAGDYLGVKTDIERLAAANPSKMSTTLQAPTDAELRAYAESIRRRLSAAAAASGLPSGVVGIPSMVAPAGPTVNVTQNVPRGYRGDLLADAHKAARRSGGLYHRNSR